MQKERLKKPQNITVELKQRNIFLDLTENCFQIKNYNQL